MSASIIDGKSSAKNLRNQIADQVRHLNSQSQIIPGLAAILVGNDPASQVYVRNKEKQTMECGMMSAGRKLPSDTSQKDLLSYIEKLNNDSSVHGILVQLPLPPQIDPSSVIQAIRPEKDVDGFHPSNVGALASGEHGLIPCTPMGCNMLLKEQLGDLSGANAVIVGRSNIVGKPMAQLLLAENCTVTIAHSKTLNLKKVCRQADILVAAVGQPQFIKADWIKPGATVIDVGINRIQKENEIGKYKLVGDVDFTPALDVAGAITPVPGGVGPMTIACLLQNTLIACLRQNNLL